MGMGGEWGGGCVLHVRAYCIRTAPLPPPPLPPAQDKHDDVKANIKSTALHLGSHTKPYLLAFGAAATAGLLATGAAGGCGPVYTLGVGLAATHLGWQVGGWMMRGQVGG